MAAKFLFINLIIIQIPISFRYGKILVFKITDLFLTSFYAVYRSILVLAVLLFIPSCAQKEYSTSRVSSSPSRFPEEIQKDSLQQRLIDLEIEEAFWKNKVSMSQDASIDLAIDLTDSMMYLEIKGVPVRKTKIITCQISNSVLSLKMFSAYRTWLANPFKLKRDSISSIPKEPVFIKDLSTTPLESFDDWTYFTRLENEGSVHFLLEFDRGLVIQVDQDQDTLSVESPFQEPELHGHWIKVVIPAIDAKAIYRALNTSSTLSLRY